MDLFYNSSYARYARFIGMESHMGIQGCREAWQARLACGSSGLVHELADKFAYLVGV
jgi:hypothetical protein